jgi:hypothetical protein
VHGKQAVGQKLTELGLRPPVHNAVNDLVEVRPRVDVVRDACRDDREDVAAPFAALVEPGEEPILATEDQPSELALSSVVGRFDVAVFEEEEQSWPLAIQVAESFAERRFGRSDGLVVIDPGAKLVEDRSTEALASLAPLLSAIARARRLSLDRKEAGDDPHAFERNAVASARGFDEATPCVRPAAGALAARALEEAHDARAIALHGAREVGTKKALDALGVADGRVEEAHPSCVGPSPHRAAADPFGRVAIEHRDAGGVGAEQPGAARLLTNEASHRREQIERRSDAAPERLRQQAP